MMHNAVNVTAEHNASAYFPFVKNFNPCIVDILAAINVMILINILNPPIFDMNFCL